jgi:hypothetical protein
MTSAAQALCAMVVVSGVRDLCQLQSRAEGKNFRMVQGRLGRLRPVEWPTILGREAQVDFLVSAISSIG